MNLSKLSRRAVIGIGSGLAVATSVAFAATLVVTTSKVTTSNTSVSIPPITCALEPSADAALDRASQGSNYGSVALLAVRSQDKNNQRRSLVRFDIASCGIPTAAVVRSAQLSLTATSGPSSNRTYNVHRVTAAWTEGTVTYQNQPAFAVGATASTATGTNAASLSWSVLSDVQSIVTGTADNGWLIKDSAEDLRSAVETVFGSRESSTRPTLTITYYR